MELTRERAIAEHRKMWIWIADETEKRGKEVTKTEYFLNYGIKERVVRRCFCCEYAIQTQESMQTDTDWCHWCPIDWGTGDIRNACLDSLYNVWTFSDDIIEAAQLARQIADLPERTDNMPVSKNK